MLQIGDYVKRASRSCNDNNNNINIRKHLSLIPITISGTDACAGSHWAPQVLKPVQTIHLKLF